MASVSNNQAQLCVTVWVEEQRVASICGGVLARPTTTQRLHKPLKYWRIRLHQNLSSYVARLPATPV
jgi:hypothetical protein